MSLLAFFIWGTGALKDFAFALIVGSCSAPTRPIYVALPFTGWLDRRFFRKGGGPQEPRRHAAPRRTRSRRRCV